MIRIILIIIINTLILTAPGYSSFVGCDFNKNYLLKSSELNSEINKGKFKIKFNDSWFGKDKADHCMVSLFLVVGSYYYLSQEQQLNHNKSIYISTCFSLTFGVIKEVRDGFMRANAASIKDLVADIGGVCLGNILFNLDR